MRNYVIRDTEQEDAPIIESGESSTFYTNDTDLVPAGYQLEHVQNTPKLKTIYVEKAL